jgi:hypothetical protein
LKWRKGAEKGDCSPISMSKNRTTTISRYDYLKTAQLFDWATKEHYVLWFMGEKKRHKRTEVMLPRLVNQEKLIAKRYGKKLVYIVPRKGRKPHPNIEHGLGCTGGLVRIWRSRMDGVIIPEREFRGFGIVPEWGIGYHNGKMLLYEFCTAKNFFKSGNVQGKITRYNRYLPLIEQKFGREGIVLFVIDVNRRIVDEFVTSRMPLGSQFFFTDYKTFRYENIGEQLTAPIYIWGDDSWPYPLEENNVQD